MNETLKPGMRTGTVTIPASKSYAHRYLIMAALSTSDSVIRCEGLSNDITATMDCLNSLGADIVLSQDGTIHVSPIREVPSGLCHLHCRESGSTLRFLLPLVGALKANAVFHMEGRLPARPLAPLDEVLTAHGMTLRKDSDLLYVSGALTSGSYSIPGNISSQYISGLLMALPLLSGKSTLDVTGTVESRDYIAMTEDVVRGSGICYDKAQDHYRIPGAQRSALSGHVTVEADWSNAAFFLSIGALSDEGVLVRGLNLKSAQGDSRVLNVLRTFGASICETDEGILIKKDTLKGCVIDAAPIPDLIPVLCTVASLAEGTTRVINASRLRLKESDRIVTTCTMLSALGADIHEEGDDIVVTGRPALTGGTTETFLDHRIAMSAAVAATASTGPVTILNAECVQKSYPRFFDDFSALKETT